MPPARRPVTGHATPSGPANGQSWPPSSGRRAAPAGFAEDVDLHPADPRHAADLARLYAENRAFLRPWEPEGDDAFYTPAGQRRHLEEWRADMRERSRWAALIHHAGEPVGFITLNHIVWGPLRNCRIGYWVAQPHCGQGIASAAVVRCLRVAFETLRLHRVEASVRTDNPASIRVLQKNEFRRIGLARGHVHLTGRWHDEWIYERHVVPVSDEPATDGFLGTG
jgi:[ribosomal protein S5]-alanine N-acetyltransferase